MASDRETLLALYRSTDGANWRRSKNWGTDEDLSEWYGVEVNGQGRVVKLILWGKNLRGFIPPQLGHLSALTELDLYNNKLEGHIPPQLGHLSALTHLYLHNNKLEGHIPPQLGDLSALTELYLNKNKLKGHIPPQLGDLSALTHLVLYNNKLEGEIPPQLGKLSALTVLSLSRNELEVHIPPQLGDLSALTELYLYNNKLEGPIPPQLGDLSALTTLDLSNNKLEGEIPPQLGKLSALTVLSLSRNELEGHIPRELGDLSALTLLHLSHNKLEGHIPRELGDLSALKRLNLSDNKLEGPIPDKLRHHRNFSEFSMGNFAMDGPPLPPVTSEGHALKIVILPVVLGYADLASDLYTAVSYKSDHPIWFWLGLVFALGPAVITAVFFLRGIRWFRRVLVATQLSLLFEALITVDEEEYSPVLALVRVVEPLFESVPQLLLQLYAMLRIWTETSESSSRLGWRVVSVCVSAASLAYAATDVSSVEKLLHQTGGDNDTAVRIRLCPCLPCLTRAISSCVMGVLSTCFPSLWGRFFSLSSVTGVVFSRVPEVGTPSVLKGLGSVHPRSHVWLCFVYHVLEIISRFVSLAMLFLVLRGWSGVVVPYLWISRGLIVWMLGSGTGRTALDFRFRVRLVAMPFLDSIVDGTLAFGMALVVTLVEFVSCLSIYHVYTEDDLPFLRATDANGTSHLLYGG